MNNIDIRKLEKDIANAYEKQIAQAILDAQKMHEESWSERGNSADGYTKEWEDCFIEACKKNNLSKNLWYLLSLANHWINDIQLWAEDIIAGKDTNGIGIKIEDDTATITYGKAVTEERQDELDKSNSSR